MIYEGINPLVISRVPRTSSRVLDLGCGSGTTGKWIKKELSCNVVGVTHSEEEALLAEKWLDQVVVHDLNNFTPSQFGQFDCIICSHVLEHLYQPGDLLKKLRDCLTPQGTLIIALPNALYWKQRLEFLCGRFRYTSGGLMDNTHFRFFDWDSAFEMVQSAGFRVTERVADGIFPLRGLRKILRTVAFSIDNKAGMWMPGLFGWQFLIVACLPKYTSE